MTGQEAACVDAFVTGSAPVDVVELRGAVAALVAERDKLLNEGIHAAVSFTYIDGEAARIKARVALKNAAGWPLSDGEMERLAALAAGGERMSARETGRVTDPEAVNRENDWWSNPRLEPILIGIYEDDMGDGYAKRLAARTALVELERERAALVAERDAAIAAVGEPCAWCGHIDWRSDPNPLLEQLEQAVAERDRNQRKVDAYDSARAVVKTEGNSRAYYVLRAENAEAIAEQAVAERDALKQKLSKIGPSSDDGKAPAQVGQQSTPEREEGLTDWHAEYKRMQVASVANAAEARQAVAERDRYRDALERIMNSPGETTAHSYAIARAALEGE